jgi:predicted Zn-dependent peptidase
LDWVSDIYKNSKLEQEEIDRERGTILQELNMYLDTPQRYVQDLWLELLYGDQPAGWRVIGTKTTINSVTRDDFLKYVKKHYSAKNTIVVVAGNIDHKSTSKKVKEYFEGIRNINPGSKPKVKETQSKPEVLLQYKDTDQTHLNLGVRAYNNSHPDKYALALLATILGGNMSSRLFISVRERQGLAYYIGTKSDLDPDAGFLVTKSGVDNNKVEKAIKTILKEYQDIAQNGVSQEELRKSKDYIKGNTLLDMEASDEQAGFFGFQELLNDEILNLEEKFKKFETVTEEDIQRVAQDIFKPEKLNLAMIGPFKDKKRFEKLLDL